MKISFGGVGSWLAEEPVGYFFKHGWVSFDMTLQRIEEGTDFFGLSVSSLIRCSVILQQS